MTDQVGRPDRRSERHEATRREIVQVAWELSRTGGLAGWSLRDVADRVGMRAPSLYVYFASKNALYDAMFADGYGALLERIQGTSRRGTPTTVLRRAARLFVEFGVEDPARFQLLFLRTIPGFEPSPGSYARAQQALDELVLVLRAAGVTDGRDVDLWTATLTGLATQQISNDPGGTRWLRLVDDAARRLLRLDGAGRADAGG